MTTTFEEARVPRLSADHIGKVVFVMFEDRHYVSGYLQAFGGEQPWPAHQTWALVGDQRWDLTTAVDLILK